MTLFQQTFVVDSIATTRLERTVLSLSHVHNGLHRNQLLGYEDKGTLTLDIASARRPEIGPGQRIDINIALSAAASEAYNCDYEALDTIDGVAVRVAAESGRDYVVNELRAAIKVVESFHRRTDTTGIDEALTAALHPFRGLKIDPMRLSELACEAAGIKPPDFLPDNPTGFTPSGDPVRDLESIATKLSELQGVETTKITLQALIGRCDHALDRGTPAIGLKAENKARSDRQVTVK